MKNVAIIGAGPAGLTAAYELLDKSSEYCVTVFEESGTVGGIARTVNYKGNYMDMGGHRFFTKVPSVNLWWDKMLPKQGALSYDDLMLGRKGTLADGGPDPQKTDKVMLIRHRISRIFFQKKFFDYPISLKIETFRNMGLITTVTVGLSYLKSVLFKRPEHSLEDFYINRFGKKLYSMFFENYTENLWGRHPSEISADWGAQRVKGLSIKAILRNMIEKTFCKKNRKIETSLIEEFLYPKFGPGQLWEIVSEEIRKKGGNILFNSKVVGIVKNENSISSIVYSQNGVEQKKDFDIVISSMPLKDLIHAMNDVPDSVRSISEGLPYRDYMTVGVLLKSLNLVNKTNIKTLGGGIPDNWVYVHDKNIKMGRFQIYNNWSPYMVKDIENTFWLGLEYFCNEGDSLWSLTDSEFGAFAVDEMIKMGLVSDKNCVADFHVERVKKAYPAYFDTYEHIDKLEDYLNTIRNLYCVGRNGQHRYNNIDHSMCTAFEAVKNIFLGTADKSNIWNVNTEKEYHESAK
ncbi:MAG: NAD(P)/FAD-dependent oxidoreductase [Treponema sp.]|nr:NAD(P)/FAD-dependent oxidoreductase [Treponema sp.]